MKITDVPGMKVTTGPARRTESGWEVPVSVKMTRLTRLRMRLTVPLLRLAVWVAPPIARGLIRARLAG